MKWFKLYSLGFSYCNPRDLLVCLFINQEFYLIITVFSPLSMGGMFQDAPQGLPETVGSIQPHTYCVFPVHAYIW